MTYRIVFTPAFADQVRACTDYLLERRVSHETVERWHERLIDLIDRLDVWPNRFPVDETQSRLADRPTRKMNYGDYLVFYQVDDVRREVHIVGFLHGARRRGPDTG